MSKEIKQLQKEKEKIIKKLIDWGNNPKETKDLVNKHFDYIKRVYPKETISQKAKIIKTIGNKNKFDVGKIGI